MLTATRSTRGWPQGREGRFPGAPPSRWFTLACLIWALGCSDGDTDDVASDQSVVPSPGPPASQSVRPSSTTPSSTTPSSTAPPSDTSPPSDADTALDHGGREQRRGELRWAPPAHWEDYDVVEISRDGGRLRLDRDVDYLLSTDRPITAPLEIIGGRNVVWIGGAIVIDRPEAADEPHRAIGLTIRDGDDSEERTVHIEGLLLSGNGLNEGINVDAPSAIVQLQNVHIESVSFEGADDRDGTGSYEGMGANHPDVVQVYGGHRELRVDGLSATSAYQGLFLKVDHPDGRYGTVRLRRVDLRAVEVTGVDGIDYAGNRMYFWDAQTIGDQFIEGGTVWIEHHPDAGKVAASPNERPGSGSWWHGAYRDGSDGDLVAEPPPGNALATDAVERLSPGDPVIEPRVGVDGDGFYMWWPRSGSDDRSDVRNAGGDDTGRLHVGTPPGGPYVPASSVGVDYRSPGYADGTAGANR